MPRYLFEISYNGAHYAGWQSQRNAIGVQTVVEDALTKILREEIKIVGSGRTDTGVHCEQQFFHATIEKPIDKDQLLLKLNSLLPKDIAIHSIRVIKDIASARFDATERTYRYRITKRKNPFLDGFALHYYKVLDIQTMNKAAALLLGEHDFACFSKVKTDVNHFRCTIKKAAWKEEGSNLEFVITANRFLRGMVRAIVGTLLDVGAGKMSLSEFREIIKSKDRRKAGQNVPPHGLYLINVKYPSTIFID